ncbi:MAG: hypothetical protein VX028_01790 [Nanoarchaeota archaeon]|nr:hypothetical protein [Nanoarchaeota archaeon]MEC8339928.1 hypothetical protein [Nanoarchaeota archaeon]
MKYFHRNEIWVVDKRSHDKSNFTSNQRQIDKIKNSLPCSVAEAFVIVGIFFDTNPEKLIAWNSELKNKKLFDLIQETSNTEQKEYYCLFFDDDSPVLFRKSQIGLFEKEEDMKFANELISKKLSTIGSNAVVRSYLFKPD